MGDSNKLCSRMSNSLSPLNFNSTPPDYRTYPQKCTWSPFADPETSPHTKVDWRNNEKILSNILEAVGNTPLVKLNKIPQSLGLKCEILVKCEYFNPGASVKDRIGFRMIEDAEKAGILKPGATIIEPTSGNTGIGLAIGAAVKGYRCIIVISEKMSDEKIDVLKALGAEIVRTPITADSSSPEGLFGVSNRLKQEIPGSIILDQYSNPGNPLAHYDCTAEEILDECDGKVDMLIVGTGTCGTIHGLGKKFKEKSPNTIVVGVDPEGSILAEPVSLNQTDTDFYETEGVGYDFFPIVLERKVVDKWVKVNDLESLPMARRLIREEGLLVGGSSGANLAGAIKCAKDLKEGQRVVVILPDSVRNYITKFIADPWMEEKGFKEVENRQNHYWWDYEASTLKCKPIVTSKTSATIDEVFELMKKENVEVVPLVDDKGTLLSVITIQKLLSVLTGGDVAGTDPAIRASSNIFHKVPSNAKLGLISRILERNSYVLLTDKKGKMEKPVGVVTAIDLLSQIKNLPATNNSNNK